MPNQNPEQIARDRIDKQLTACGWSHHRIKPLNLLAESLRKSTLKKAFEGQIEGQKHNKYPYD